LSTTVNETFGEDPIRDDPLHMIFMCCGADISMENRIPLILKTLCGLSKVAPSALARAASHLQNRPHLHATTIGACQQGAALG
jgi:predicted RNA polymerase sigma factor